jgi:hypothetical protein
MVLGFHRCFQTSANHGSLSNRHGLLSIVFAGHIKLAQGFVDSTQLTQVDPDQPSHIIISIAETIM